MVSKKVATSLNLLGINTVTNLAAPSGDLDALRKIDLRTEATRLEALLGNVASGVSLTQVRQEISSAVAGVFKLMGNADAFEANAIAATGVAADHVFQPGDTYRVTSAGQAFGMAANVGDMVAYTPGGWVLLEGSGDATIAQGDGLVVDFAGGIYSIALAPQVLQQLTSLATSVSQAQADATVARGLAEAHEPKISQLEADRQAYQRAIAALELAAQALQIQAKVVSFRFVDGQLTHAQGTPATLANNGNDYEPIPGLPGYQWITETTARAELYFYVRHPKQGTPKMSIFDIDNNGNADVVADFGHYSNDATGMPDGSNGGAWITVPTTGTYMVTLG